MTGVFILLSFRFGFVTVIVLVFAGINAFSKNLFSSDEFVTWSQLDQANTLGVSSDGPDLFETCSNDYSVGGYHHKVVVVAHGF